jgi:hypothetical protein
MQNRPLLEVASWIAGILAAIVGIWAFFKPSPAASENKSAAAASQPSRGNTVPLSRVLPPANAPAPALSPAPVPAPPPGSKPAPGQSPALATAAPQTHTQPLDAVAQTAASNVSTATDQTKPQKANVGIADFDGEWESPAFRYGFDLRSGRGRATLSNSPSFAPGDTILKIERVTNARFYGEQTFSNGSWVKVTGRLLIHEKIEMNGGGFTWVMERQ